VTKAKSHKFATAIVGIIFLGVISSIAYFGFLAKSNVKQIESIAVMPFVNESGNADVEYLSDGMTETLINSLSQLPNLNVKARSSVFRYKGKEIDPKKIASELNVQAILTGQVVQRGEQLRLSLELIDAQTENVIWSEQYNRRQADLVSLQSEIARDVSSKLKTKLSGTDEQKVTKNYTTNPEAYQLYLKGRFQWNKRTGESLKQAVEFYKQAVEKDPNFAQAYSGLAETYALFPVFSVALPEDSMPQAKTAALRALELDDSLDGAHAALGLYLSAFAWNQPAAEAELRRAIELNPNNATAYQWLGIVLVLSMGRFNEGIAAGRRAEELDPLSPVISADSGVCLYGARRYDEAIAQLKRALTLDPNFYYTRFNLGTVYHAKGMYSEAIVEYRKARELDDDPFVTALLARSLAKSGGRGEAAKLRDQLRAESARRYVPNIAFALVYAALDDKDEAFKWLEKDVAERSFYPSFYAYDPFFDDLRDDPRFADLVRRVESTKMD
jgi:TolB-like protein/Tfp pilus assembly protein PilF